MIALMFATLMVPMMPAPSHCAPPRAEFTDSERRAVPRKLGELPPAKQYLTVYRAIDRCPAPVIVRTGIGATQR